MFPSYFLMYGLTTTNIILHFNLWIFRTYLNSTFEIFVPCNFDTLTIRFHVISTCALFYHMFFLPLDISPKIISTFGRFVPMSFRTWEFSVLCHFEFLWYFDLRTFRPYVISTFSLFIIGHIFLWTSRSLATRFSKFSFLVISTHAVFDFLSFRLSHFSVVFHFDLWTVHQSNFDLWKLRENFITNFGHFAFRPPFRLSDYFDLPYKFNFDPKTFHFSTLQNSPNSHLTFGYFALMSFRTLYPSFFFCHFDF